MSDSICLSPLARPRGLFMMLRGPARRCLLTAQTWRRRQGALHDLSVLREMSDRELVDLGIGRGEFTRDAGSG